MQQIFIFLLLLAQSALFAQQQINLVKDINAGPGSSFGSATFAQNDSILVFNANDQVHGFQLWRSDGTESGTYLLQELYPSPSNQLVGKIAVFQGKFWFIVGGKLYASDGTTPGTVIIKTFNNPTFYLGPVFVVFKDELYFSYGVGGQGEELWKTDGTLAGTVLVKDINPGGADGRPDNFMVVGDQLFFNAQDGVNGFELWKTDGTTVGTTLVKDIHFGNLGSSIFNGVGTPIGAFFVANDGTHGKELWFSDGTEAGTHLIKDINPNGNGVNQLAGDISHGYVNGKAVFIANDGQNGDEPWSTDGTEAGTGIIKNIGPGSQHGTAGTKMWIYEERAFFNGADGEPWTTDGTETGTFQLKDITSNASLSTGISDFVLYKGKYCFVASGSAGKQIWETDGTTAGTQVLADLLASNADDELGNLQAVSNTLFMYGTNGTTGRELYSIGGADVSTRSPFGDLPVLRIQPNPAQDRVRIGNLPDEVLTSRLDLLSSTGLLLKSWSEPGKFEQGIDVSTLPTGLYWLHLVSPKQQMVGQLMIVR